MPTPLPLAKRKQPYAPVIALAAMSTRRSRPPVAKNPASWFSFERLPSSDSPAAALSILAIN